ncbi:MAG: hypothetical protein GF346_05300 [Candidatus Eisenbacteria bacterium]|nr:hypothetical protein [Candidatus Latescibacterota bacterium]MBD3301843.1 hypothetical protein [Candidatus Eisenbacteria bacterium]
MEEILREITGFVRRERPDAEGEIEAIPVHELFDSIAMIDFLTYLERTFGIRISDADVLPENFSSLAAVARLVARKRSAG